MRTIEELFKEIQEGDRTCLSPEGQYYLEVAKELQSKFIAVRDKPPCISCENFRRAHNRMVFELQQSQEVIAKLRGELVLLLEKK